MWYIVSVIIIAGVTILTLAFHFASRIITELKDGKLNTRWTFLRSLMLVFIAGYLAYWWFVPSNAGIESLIASVVFLLGSLYALVMSWLMLRTVQNIKRVAVLEQETITDPLLGIYNRRYLEQRLKEEVTRAQRYHLPLSLLLIDIDHFKEINDYYGHQTGDIVLINIAKILQAQVREIDLVGRYGGEEMEILLPNTGEEEASNIAERIRQTIQQTTFTEANIHNGNVECTISIGVASLTGDSPKDIDLLRRADLALYHVKQTGRNRIAIYKPEYEKNTLSYMGRPPSDIPLENQSNFQLRSQTFNTRL